MSEPMIYGLCERVVGHFCGRGTGGCGQITCSATATRLHKGHPVCEPCHKWLNKMDEERETRKANEESRPKSKMERVVQQCEVLADKLKRKRSEG